MHFLLVVPNVQFLLFQAVQFCKVILEWLISRRPSVRRPFVRRKVGWLVGLKFSLLPSFDDQVRWELGGKRTA